MNTPIYPRDNAFKHVRLNQSEKRSDIWSGFSKSILFLFLFFGFYITAPLIDVPLLGLSLSAPVFFLIAVPVLFRSPHPWPTFYRNWVLLAVSIWLGIFLSAVLNGFVSGGTRVDGDTLLSLIRYAYWLLTFVITVYLLTSQLGWMERMVYVLSAGIALLGVFRLGEAVFGGAIGAWTNLRFLSQNSYGIQFSTFFPFVFSLMYFGRYRILALLGSLSTLAAILINGSRSNWLAILVSLLVLIWMILRTQRQRVRSAAILLLVTGLLGLGVMFSPQLVITSFEKRFATFQNLEADKSYAIRQLMVQKGITLFRSSPLIGVGISRWRKESLPLNIPFTLLYAPQSHFDAKSSHNSYISFLAENGLVGMIPYGMLLLTLTIHGYISADRLARRGQLWGIGVYASFVGMSIHLWTLSGLTGTLAWFIYGMVAAMITFESHYMSKNANSLPLRLKQKQHR